MFLFHFFRYIVRKSFFVSLFSFQFFFLSSQLGTLGAGNHYAEIQVVDDIYDEYAAKKMGIDHKGQVCVMIHSGSRGLGHQVATGMWFNRLFAGLTFSEELHFC